MPKSPKSRARDSRSQKSRTGRTSKWEQHGEKKTENKKRAADAIKLKKVAAQEEKKKKEDAAGASEPAIVGTPRGRFFRAMNVAGHGRCSMLAVCALSMFAKGMPCKEVSSLVCPKIGDISVELKDEVQSIRNAIAGVPDDDLPLKDGEESQTLEYVLQNSSHLIETKRMFRAVALLEKGYLGPLAMRLAARHMKMDGIRVVVLAGGVLAPVDDQGDLTDTDVNFALYDGYGHYMALVPVKPEAVDPVAEGEGETGDDGAPASEADDAVDDAAVQPEDVGAPSAEPGVAVDGGDVASDAEGALDAEDDEEDEAEGVAEADEEGAAGETVDATAPIGDVGQCPTFRNRAGRRMAGRRKAQPSRIKGQGGSKYLKRCPARDTRVRRKRGRGRGQEGHGVTWPGVVRGGAQPGEGECKGCGNAATFCYQDGDVVYCSIHQPGTMGWAPKITGRRKKKPSAKQAELDSVEAPEDERAPKAKKQEAKKQKVAGSAPAFDGAIPTGSSASAPSSVDSRDGENGGGTAKAKAKGTTRDKTPPPAEGGEGGSGEKTRQYSRVGNGHKDLGDHLCEHWSDEVKLRMAKNKKEASEQVAVWKGTVTTSTPATSDTMTYYTLMNTLCGWIDWGWGRAARDCPRQGVLQEGQSSESQEMVQPQRKVQPDRHRGGLGRNMCEDQRRGVHSGIGRRWLVLPQCQRP